MEQKTYKTYRQQLSKLRSRGMVIKQGSQGSRVMRILERENYYNIINGYNELFLTHPATAIADGLSCRAANTYKLSAMAVIFIKIYAVYRYTVIQPGESSRLKTAFIIL